MACTKLETSRYLNQWSPEFCQYIGSSGLNSGPVNQGNSPALTVDILRHMLSAHPVWTISAYGVQRWIVDKNKFTNLRLFVNLTKVLEYLDKYQVLWPSSTSKYQVLLNFKRSSTSKYQVLDYSHQVPSTKYKYFTWPQPCIQHHIQLTSLSF